MTLIAGAQCGPYLFFFTRELAHFAEIAEKESDRYLGISQCSVLIFTRVYESVAVREESEIETLDLL